MIFRDGLVSRIKILSFIRSKERSCSLPIMVNWSLLIGAQFLECCNGGNICRPFNGWPVRADKCTCSSNRFSQYLKVEPRYPDLHLGHLYSYMTPERSDLGIMSLYLNHDDILCWVLNTTCKEHIGNICLKLWLSFFLIFSDTEPMKGKMIRTTFLGTVVTGIVGLYILSRKKN